MLLNDELKRMTTVWYFGHLRNGNMARVKVNGCLVRVVSVSRYCMDPQGQREPASLASSQRADTWAAFGTGKRAPLLGGWIFKSVADCTQVRCAAESLSEGEGSSTLFEGLAP